MTWLDCEAPSPCKRLSDKRRDRQDAGVGDLEARGGEPLDVEALDLLERFLERGVELHVVERERDLAGELREHPLGLVRERDRVRGPLRDDQPEQGPGVDHRRHAHDALPPVLHQLGDDHHHTAPGIFPRQVENELHDWDDHEAVGRRQKNQFRGQLTGRTEGTLDVLLPVVL